MGRPQGFTLVELLTVMMVLAIVTAVAGPAARQLLSSQRVKGVAYDLAADLMLARSEALKRNAAVSVSPQGGRWDQGWTVAVPTAGLTLRERSAYGENLNLTGAPTGVAFQANGRLGTPTTQVRMSLAPPTGYDGARCVDLNLAGRVRVEQGMCQ